MQHVQELEFTWDRKVQGLVSSVQMSVSQYTHKYIVLLSAIRKEKERGSRKQDVINYPAGPDFMSDCIKWKSTSRTITFARSELNIVTNTLCRECKTHNGYTQW